MLALGVVPFMIAQLRQKHLKALKAQISQLNPKREEVDRVQGLLESLRDQEVAFNALSQEGSSWAKRLSALSKLTPEGVWFSEFSLDVEKGLIIRGLAIGEGGAEMVRVGRLVQDIKASSEFSSVVKDVQIESIKRVQEDSLEIIQFTLVCTLLRKER